MLPTLEFETTELVEMMEPQHDAQMDTKTVLEYIQQECTMCVDGPAYKTCDIEYDEKGPNQTSIRTACSKGFRSHAALENHLQSHKNHEKCTEEDDTIPGIKENASHDLVFPLSDFQVESVHNTFNAEAEMLPIKTESGTFDVQDTNPSQGFVEQSEVTSHPPGNYKSIRLASRIYTVDIEQNEPSQSWVCSDNLETQSMLAQEQPDQHSSVIAKKCSFCNKSFECANTLRVHLKEHLAGRAKPAQLGESAISNKCHICFKTYTTKKYLNVHLRTHSGIYQCRSCNIKCTNEKDFKVHLKLHRGTHECTTCNKKFTNLSELGTHEATHRGFKPIKCELCEKRFADKYGLKKHLRTHLDVRPHKCHLCGKSFTQLTHLRGHLEGHSKPRNSTISDPLQDAHPHHCALCQKSYQSSSALLTHMQYKHSGAPNFKCHKCDKSFVRAADLNRHLRRHLGVKPFKCTSCLFTFTEAPDLTKHLKAVHKGGDGAMYGCDYCESSFEGCKALRRHLEQHQLQKTYKCTICGAVFDTILEVSHHKAQHEDEEANYAGNRSQLVNEENATMIKGVQQNSTNSELVLKTETMSQRTELTEDSTATAPISVKSEPQESAELQATFQQEDGTIEIKLKEEFLSDNDEWN